MNFTGDWHSPHVWTVVASFIADLAVGTTLDFQGDGKGSGDLIESNVAGQPAWATKCTCTTGVQDWVVVTHGGQSFTIARFTTPTLVTIKCYPPGTDPLFYGPNEGEYGAGTGASWTAQEGSNGLCGPPAGDES